MPTSVRIVNPQGNATTISYNLDGELVDLAAGEAHKLTQVCVIEFDRGNNLGAVRYALFGGTYTFGVAGDGGWQLYRTDV